MAPTTAAVAAALWFPYRAAPADAVLRWATASLAVFTALAADPATGVILRDGTVVHRTPEPDLWWAPGIAGLRPATADELPPGAPAGTRCVLPVVDMGRYLPWLVGACLAAGVEIVPGRVDRLPDVPGDVVVLAAGLRSGELAGDGSLVPVQGQVVRLANPGLHDWLLDEDNPAGLTYVVPRGDDVVCGGTAVEGATGTDPDPDVEAAILARATALCPGAARRRRALPRGRTAPRPPHGPPRPDRGRRAAADRLLRPRRRRRHPVLGLRRRRRRAHRGVERAQAPIRRPGRGLSALSRAAAGQPASACSAIWAYSATPVGSGSSSNTTRLEWFAGAVAGSTPGGHAPRNAIAPGTRCST